MNELQPVYPELTHLIHASAIVPFELVENFCKRQGVIVDPGRTNKILSLMTPPAARMRIDHEPEIIDSLASFESLLARKDDITKLKLVPRRSDAVQSEYEKVPSELFEYIVTRHYLNGSQLSIVRELFPSDLSEDIEQHVVWANQGTGLTQIAELVDIILHLSGLTPEEIIMFQRSPLGGKKYMSAAIPKIDHVHVWSKGSNISSALSSIRNLPGSATTDLFSPAR